MAARPAWDPYAVLGLEPGASRADVRRAYRRRAMAIHPDVASGDASDAEATAEMAQLNRAREELLARAPVRGRAVHASGPREAPSDPATRPKPRPEREKPAGTEDHEAAWSDHWSAWNELPRRR